MRFDFLICTERSGSNLITKIIDSHPNFCGPSPIHLLRAFHDKMNTYDSLEIDENWKSFIIDVITFFEAKIGIWTASFIIAELIQIEDRSLLGVIKFIYGKEALSNAKQHSFIKEVKTYHMFEYILMNFDHPKFIWLVRDPRDMVLSWIQSPVHRGDAIRAASIWKEDQNKTYELYQKNSDKVLLIKYEDLLTQQNIIVEKMCSFLNISFDVNMLSFHENTISKKNALQSDNWKNLDKKVIINNFKKYKEGLSTEQIKYIEFICHKEMCQLGYDLEYPLLSKEDFIKVESELQKIERYNKLSYQNISEMEKQKRNKWFEKFTEIKNR